MSRGASDWAHSTCHVHAYLFLMKYTCWSRNQCTSESVIYFQIYKYGGI